MKDQHFRADSSRSLRACRRGCCHQMEMKNCCAFHPDWVVSTAHRRGWKTPQLCTFTPTRITSSQLTDGYVHARTGFSYLPRTNLQSVTGQLCAKHYFLRRVENAQLESCSTADFRPDSTGTTQHALANTKTTLALSFSFTKAQRAKETECRQLCIPLVLNKNCRGQKT